MLREIVQRHGVGVLLSHIRQDRLLSNSQADPHFHRCPDKLKKVRQLCEPFLLGPTVPGRGLSNKNCLASSWGRLDNEDVFRLDLAAKIDSMGLKERKPFNEASSNIILLALGEIVSTSSEKRAGEMTKPTFVHQHDSASITKKLKNIGDEEKVSYAVN